MGLSVAGMRASRRCLLTRKLANPPYVSKDIQMSRSQRTQSNPNWNGGRSVKNGYRTLLIPEHYRADSSGYVLEHILIAERALGRSLPAKAVVHHVDEQQGRINPHGLVICPNENYHRMLHQRSRAFDACGNANWRKCSICKRYDAIENLRLDGFGHARHKECINEESRVRDARGRSQRFAE